VSRRSDQRSGLLGWLGGLGAHGREELAGCTGEKEKVGRHWLGQAVEEKFGEKEKEAHSRFLGLKRFLISRFNPRIKSI
jgi:hypothetical protein